eukprot:CAMPEP_0174331924 /NCGR_PEP_ID=MMETSP0810-20121108/17876_1 /TAXON_ID=73025 ORGANISM="Eutreptiella gymnastica-like, Strain CCMP1594" /NCGR_SAMPLE_ID=MMETSP0810 /ASSEMBLY_ACC=CAM_ASM_000659 /LENGTH=39 /DNA_ID= /DNA_START= /DNA_END= /DNA_ORIENTATION=
MAPTTHGLVGMMDRGVRRLGGIELPAMNSLPLEMVRRTS